MPRGSLKASRQKRQIRAVVNAMGPLSAPEVTTVLVAINQCADDPRRGLPVEATDVSVEEQALFAAYNAAMLAPGQSFFAGALGLSAEEAAAFCARIRDAAVRVAARQGRRSVLDGFKALDAADSPDRV